ncbi:uncharacterized protein LOC110701547 [Chenopodium quinoa]|uniref:uncharacterized protein LOC110701547 n=1 Tax=Chenopodium quinoa TaxID=63459 RepID=UPI000B77C7A7|nr:uncharacterized protein LOC110701547 [Chenopodium quinoa]
MTTPSPRSTSSQASTTRTYVVTDKDREKVTSTWMRVMRKKVVGMQKTGDTISITIPESVFLNENGLDVSLDFEDVLDWCFQREVGESQMKVFMKHLKERCQKEGVSGMYGFCDCNVLSPLKPTTGEQVPSDYLAHDFGTNEGKNVNQLFFSPYNDNLHWTLAVISPWNGLMYWLDPLGAENEINSLAQKIINEGIVKFSMKHRKDIKKIKKESKNRVEATTLSSTICIHKALWLLCMSLYAGHYTKQSIMDF